MVRAVATREGELLVELDSACLRVFNRYRLYGIESVSEAVGQIIRVIVEEDDQLRIRFGEFASIEIDVTDDAYNGPEALVATFDDGTIVVQ